MNEFFPEAAPLVDIPALYERFFALGGPPPGDEARPWQYRRKCTSLRLAGCEYLATLVRTRQPQRVLDLGSGMTSHVLRALMREVPGMHVTTTDTMPNWLATTVAELHRDGLNAVACVTQDDFERDVSSWDAFDLISVDCGNLEYRATLAPKLAEWCAPGGILVLDDWHMEPYPTTMGAALSALGFVVTPRMESLDELGGFVATAEWA